MFGLTHPVRQYREQAQICITDYCPVNLESEQRHRARVYKPLLVTYSFAPYFVETIQFVVFGGLAKALETIEHYFGVQVHQPAPFSFVDMSLVRSNGYLSTPVRTMLSQFIETFKRLYGGRAPNLRLAINYAKSQIDKQKAYTPVSPKLVRSKEFKSRLSCGCVVEAGSLTVCEDNIAYSSAYCVTHAKDVYGDRFELESLQRKLLGEEAKIKRSSLSRTLDRFEILNDNCIEKYGCSL